MKILPWRIEKYKKKKKGIVENKILWYAGDIMMMLEENNHDHVVKWD